MSTLKSKIFGVNAVSTEQRDIGKNSKSLISQKADPGKEFIFRLPGGEEIGRAASLQEFSAKLKTLPLNSLEFHMSGKHFGPWLRTMGFNVLADSVDNLNSEGERLRHDLINLFNMFL